MAMENLVKKSLSTHYPNRSYSGRLTHQPMKVRILYALKNGKMNGQRKSGYSLRSITGYGSSTAFYEELKILQEKKLIDFVDGMGYKITDKGLEIINMIIEYIL